MKYLLIALVAVLTSCGKNYTYRKVSEFAIDENALDDSAEVKLIYCSRGPDIPEKFDGQIGTITSVSGASFDPFRVLDYYNHYVVMDAGSGDTVNILTPEAIELNEDDKDRIFIFTKDVDETKKIFYDDGLLEKVKKGDKIDLDMEIPKLDRVARDPDFDNIAMNKHKTIIGFVSRK
ncbi:hypothetical protein GC194_04525 [bacterium]|nr:hypothetical protein [bacterium]